MVLFSPSLNTDAKWLFKNCTPWSLVFVGTLFSTSQGRDWFSCLRVWVIKFQCVSGFQLRSFSTVRSTSVFPSKVEFLTFHSNLEHIMRCGYFILIPDVPFSNKVFFPFSQDKDVQMCPEEQIVLSILTTTSGTECSIAAISVDLIPFRIISNVICYVPWFPVLANGSCRAEQYVIFRQYLELKVFAFFCPVEAKTIRFWRSSWQSVALLQLMVFLVFQALHFRAVWLSRRGCFYPALFRPVEISSSNYSFESFWWGDQFKRHYPLPLA